MAKKQIDDWQWDDVWLVAHMHSGMTDPENWAYVSVADDFCEQYRRHTQHRVANGKIIKRCIHLRKQRDKESTPPRLRVCYFKGNKKSYQMVDIKWQPWLIELYQRYNQTTEKIILTHAFEQLYGEFCSRAGLGYSQYDVYQSLSYLRKHKKLPKLRKEFNSRDVKREGGFFTKEQVSRKGVVRDPGNW